MSNVVHDFHLYLYVYMHIYLCNKLYSVVPVPKIMKPPNYADSHQKDLSQGATGLVAKLKHLT